MIYIATDNFNDGFPLSNAYDDTIYQKANGEYYLKFRFPVDRLGVWKHLTCETILKADDTRGLQLFKIKKINKINGYVRIYAKHITDDLNFIGVDKIAVSNATGRRVMEVLAGSTTEEHSFIFNSDVATMHTLNLSNTTAGKVLSKDKHSIIGQWGGELIRDKFLVDLKARAGVDTEILFMNKKNVKNLDNVVSTENLTTRLKLTVEKEHEGKKQIITATVDSPNINAYPRIYTNYLKVTNNNIETQQQLVEYGNKYFKDSLVDFPTDNLTVNVIDKNQEQVNLFDTVWFRNVDFNIDKRLKVVAYEYSPMAKRYKKISFGALKVANFGQIKSLSQLEEKIDEKITESFTDAFKIQQNLSQLLKLDRKAIEDKMLELEEKSKGALEVKKALFEADGTIPEVVKTKILDAVEGDIGRLKTIITEAELIKAIQAKLNYAEIKNALIDKAFINQIISDEKFTQQFEEGQVTTQNIFTKLKDSIKSNISKDFVTKEGVKMLVNDLTIDADGIRQITQQESVKVFENKKLELKGVNAYLHKKYSDFEDGRNMDNNSNRKYIGIYTGDKQQAPTSASEYSWTKIKGEDGARGRDGNNGRNGTDGHSLTASLWLTGGYVNNVINDVKLNLKVFYDGREIRDFNSVITYKGGNFNSWQTKENPTVTSYNVIDYTFWSNGEKDGSTLFALATVTYNGLQAVADTRLDNVPDVRLLSETIKKYKTFESTLDGFTSVVGEIDTKILSSAYFKNNLNYEDVEKTGNDLYFNAKENLVANEYYTILADLDNVPANQQTYMYGASDGGDKKVIQNGLNYWVVKYPDNRGNVNLYPLGANTKVKNVKIYKGDFRVKKDDEKARENLYSNSATDSTNKFIQLHLNKNKINGNVYTVKFDASGYSNGDRWDIYNRIGYDGNNLTQVFKDKDNEFTFTINDDTNPIRMYIRMIEVGNTKISNVEIYDVSTEYVKNSQVSKLESSIKQTKDEIDLKVSKDNVIASINASVEKDGQGVNRGLIKINADKVDISGVLRAYTGIIGGFRIGYNYNDNSFWLTGKDNFDCGINPGLNTGTRGAQVWAAWGDNWGKAGDNAWWVNAQGVMTCNNTAAFHRGINVYNARIDTHGNDIQGNANDAGAKTTVIWWSQINTVKSRISDKRLKTNIKPTKINALDTLNSIEMVEFNWKKDNKFEKIGAIAQQVQSVDEDLVVRDMDDKQTYNDYLRINYYDTIPYLIKAVQELSEENTNLKLRLQKLEDKINGKL